MSERERERGGVRKTMGGREREARAEQNRAEQSESMMKGVGGSVCAQAHARACVCARVSDQCSIYTSQGVGGREKHRLQLQTETETGQS